MSGDKQDQHLADKVDKLRLQEGTESVSGEVEAVDSSGEAVRSMSSATDDEDDDDDNDDEEEDESPMVKAIRVEEEMKKKEFAHIEKTYGMTEIPDSTPQILPADSELTEDVPLDTDYIDLVHMKIRSLESLGLDRFSKLESLVLRDNLIESLHEFKLLTCKDCLEELDLYDNRIKHISKHINELINLKSLDLSFNNLKHVKHVDKLTKLENLYFVQNKIHFIENLEGLNHLKNLEFGGNHVERISETILKLPSLEQLWLGQNKITKLENLDNLNNLKILSIQSNRIDHIEGLDKLQSLEELYLSHNKITKLQGLEKLSNLNVLDITGNKISRIENMKELKNLTDFWASYNLIDSFDNLHEELGCLPKLETVYLEGNPIQRNNSTQYRTKVRLNLGKSLKKIDALYIASNQMVL
ncbi:Protein phosphatase 1 regulatory subunit sds22 [Brettanomyces nanus]|uniref:Protein phosphatase 1 regulatory subunit sds22 n=1 Tax=Eeniella nana TaxID=13502 RepID=A0A875RN57_EENNA|nr:Protein phosphatase 1 regulatory subunit sds22 [Brettanomyces nanus]QPG73200.1 Protein phosphatase 1 regulatory subunit sds22 [Brettanomyces nanus]